MKEPTRRGTPTGGGPRSRSDAGGSRPPPRNQTSRADDLLQIADALEEQARTLLSQARQLQRLAASQERSGEDRTAGPGARSSGPERKPSRQGPSGRAGTGRSKEEPRGSGGDARPAKKRNNAPSWAPGGKKRKP